MKHKNKAIVWGVLTLVWTGVIFWFSLQPATQSDGLSGGLLQRILDVFYRITTIQIPLESVHNLFRKTAHFGEFFLLGIFGGNFFCSAFGKLKFVLLYGGFIAILDECLQFLTGEGRAMRVTDMFLDFSGVFCAFLCLKILGRLFFRRRFDK